VPPVPILVQSIWAGRIASSTKGASGIASTTPATSVPATTAAGARRWPHPVRSPASSKSATPETRNRAKNGPIPASKEIVLKVPMVRPSTATETTGLSS
jgi:hypothetical protein